MLQSEITVQFHNVFVFDETFDDFILFSSPKFKDDHEWSVSVLIFDIDVNIELLSTIQNEIDETDIEIFLALNK